MNRYLIKHLGGGETAVKADYHNKELNNTEFNTEYQFFIGNDVVVSCPVKATLAVIRLPDRWQKTDSDVNHWGCDE